MQRVPVIPAASCEATARLAKTDLRSSDSQVAPVSSPQVVITGTQLAFGSQDSDFKLAFDRLEKALAAKNARFDRVVISHLYVTSSALANRVVALQLARSGGTRTVLPIEALPSLDALFGLDVIAVPDSAASP